ncbi:HNH endonuclease signature motif containing protein [Mitsuokella jalaludinii]|uniref:HNH endonuclease signature motif containing protein n=1 Tax=Mitsuokella jalaludinii TaxID=187979 RepID=UPI003A8EE103
MECIKHKRVKDRKMIKAMRKNYCERCGAYADIEPHHVFTVGSGGGDIAMNLVQLCTSCHIGAHDGSIKRDELLAIVARREGVAYEDAYRVNRRAMGYMVD